MLQGTPDPHQGLQHDMARAEPPAPPGNLQFDTEVPAASQAVRIQWCHHIKLTDTVSNQFTEVSKLSFFLNCHLLALGIKAETQKPFSKQMLRFFLFRNSE